MSTPSPPPPPTPSMTMTSTTMLLPVGKDFAIRENEDGLNARSHHHHQTINSFPACMRVCVVYALLQFGFRLFIFGAIVIVVIFCTLAYVQCSPFINITKLLSSRFVSSSHTHISIFPSPTNNLIYMVLTAEYSAFAVQLFSCCVIRYLYTSYEQAIGNAAPTCRFSCYSSTKEPIQWLPLLK